MRRVWLVLAAVAISGCAKGREIFTLHADQAAEAAGQHLKGERLAQVLTSTKGLRVNKEAAEFIAGLWVDYTLFAQSIAAGKSLTDSATIAEVMWPEIAEIRGTRWHDSLVARRTKARPETADSVYHADSIRVLQQILFSVSPTAELPVKQAARKQAEATLGRIKRGADFGKLAEELTGDPTGKRDHGFVPPSPRGRFVTAFDSAAWLLPPGGLSGIVETPFGYHIIRRPPADEVRGRILDWLNQGESIRLDSVYMDSLAVGRKLKVASGAQVAIRRAMGDREGARGSGKTLVSYRGGELTLGEFLRWIRALPTQYAAQLQTADDTTLSNVASVIAKNRLLLEEADSAHVQLTDLEWKSLQQRYTGSLDTLRLSMGLGSDVSDPSVPAPERAKVAALKLDTYLDQIIAGKLRPRPLPAQLSSVLRARGGYEISQAGVARGLEIALGQQKNRSDSAGGPGPGLQPAPGPAPIPGHVVPDTGAAASGQPARP